MNAHSKPLPPRPAHAPLRWRRGAAALAALLTFGLPAQAAPVAPALSAPVLLQAVLLAAALALGVMVLRLAWAIRGTRPAAQPPRPARTMDWSRLTQLAAGFFDAHDLVPEHPDREWAEAANLVLRRGARRYLLHAGAWRAARIDVAAVQTLAREMARQQIPGGILLCASDAFTATARQLARQHGILLLHPAQFEALPERAVRPRPTATPPRAAATVAAAPSKPAPARAPVLLDDRKFDVPRTFMPTVPMSRDTPIAMPVLRPDHEFRAPRAFLPTVPMAEGEPDPRLPRQAAA